MAYIVVSWLSSYAERLNRSFAAVYTLLERPKVGRRSVLALLAIQSALLAYSAYVHSPTLNEPGHLVAGLSYWKFGRFDVYSVNPPLVKLVAALPVMAAGYEEDWSGFYVGLGARPEFRMGEDFVAANGERSYFLFMIARWACIPFSWLGGIVCYLWARDLYGRPAGVVACAIWSFEPNILAHASLMTPDAHATALGLAACYTFWRWLKHPTWTQTLVTGVVLGLAELAKTTFILLYPLWPLLWGIYRWSDRKQMRRADWLREAGMLAARMTIGLYVLNLGYGFEDSMKSLGEFQFISKMLAEHKSEAAWESGLKLRNENQGFSHQYRETGSSNRFANTSLAAIPVPFPANYLIGIDLQQHDFEDYGRHSYMRGEWRDRGWWYYYLYAATIKIPLGLWALGSLVLLKCLSVANRDMSSQSISPQSDVFILLAPPFLVFAVVSAKTGFSEHFRYILPCFPFFIIWISSHVNIWISSQEKNNGNLVDIAYNSSLNCVGKARSVGAWSLNVACPLMLLWFLASSAWIYPHSLSYFNESVGGPSRGSWCLLGSNLDWGQDLGYLQSQLTSMRMKAPIATVYARYRVGQYPQMVAHSGSSIPRAIIKPPPESLVISDLTDLLGFHVLSVNERFNDSGEMVPAAIALDRLARNAGRQEVVARCGYSMYIYLSQ